MSDPRYDPNRVAELNRRFEKKMAPGGAIDCMLAGNPLPKDAPARPTPYATIEAVMFSVRERGLAALDEPAIIERLARCDARARVQIDNRIAKLMNARRTHAESSTNV